MKAIIQTFLLLISFNVFSTSQEMEEKRYYYTALNEFFKETHQRPILKDDVNKLEELLFYTGIEILEDYENSLLEKYPTSSTRFVLGKKAYNNKDFKKALESFSLIHKDHRYYPESKMLEAEIHFFRNDEIKENESFNECQKSAEKNESSAESDKIKRYYRMINEVCLVNKARHQYKKGNYQSAIDAYNKIPKQSYKWPYILLEKAWAYYQLGDYNRSLGLLVTYKSPLLDTYFFPEAEYLAALAYFKLCLWEDSSIIINQYYNFYRPRFHSLEDFFNKNRNTPQYFHNLLNANQDFKSSSDEFVKQILTRLKKQIRFSLDLNTIHKINKEIKSIASNEKGKKGDEMLLHLLAVKENMITKINYNAKTDIFQFLESVPFYSSELFKINLEIVSRKRDLIYTNRKLIAERSRGDYSNVKRNKFEYFWKFKGAFWADELGDYSLGLKSNCEIQKNNPLSEESL
ncbi:MAG: tetratricopeptide repeat protein [Bacteriovoracaceae bacterium]